MMKDYFISLLEFTEGGKNELLDYWRFFYVYCSFIGSDCCSLESREDTNQDFLAQMIDAVMILTRRNADLSQTRSLYQLVVVL